MKLLNFIEKDKGDKQKIPFGDGWLIERQSLLYRGT